jgi:hypothetical protein
MNLNLIKEVANKESTQFLVSENKNMYHVTLSDTFKRSFPDEVNVTTKFFIDEAKKSFGDKINLINGKDSVFIIKENNMNPFDGGTELRLILSLLNNVDGLDNEDRHAMSVIRKAIRNIIFVDANHEAKNIDAAVTFISDELGVDAQNVKIALGSVLQEKGYTVNEAEYKGKDVKLNKPMRGDVKKYKVFVKDPKTGNVKKVNFGDKNMEIKRDDPERRKSFRARHKCDTAKDKTKPRYWSCKFWSTKSVSDLLSEVVKPEEVEVSKLAMRDELCPKIWDVDKMHPEVRKALLKTAMEFIKFAKIEDLKFKDIILTGSLANYNYTDSSDLDIHILLDFSQISEDREFVGEYFRNKKNLWNDRYPVKIKGHEAELYVQDTSEPHVSSGVYSIINDEWNTMPIKKMIAIDTANVQLKAADIMNDIDELEDSDNNQQIIDSVDRIMDKIKEMRKAGLEKEGEYSTENIVFKVLRNAGYLDKLGDLKKSSLTKELTLENLDESNVKNKLKNLKNAGLLTLGIVVAAISSGVSAEQLKDIGVENNMIEKAEEYVNKGIDFLDQNK